MMPNLSSLFKSEISRIARYEIKTAITPLHATTVSLKKTVSELKKRIADLETANKRLISNIPQEPQAPVESNIAEAGKVRITAKNIKALRDKLGLTQMEFAKLIGVSSNNVNLMEHKEGRIKVRSKTLASIMAVREMGKREAKKRLEEMTGDEKRI